ncbi:MAG: 16S rRNA (cytosine(1402)-N(4))-methyltransferase RsmH [Gammaproteobacteria bacterium]|nr:16S rRNA (cytosine(1402)-N(4))-methyltransferase RsmH [Gammaproteobacteria bacterium]
MSEIFHQHIPVLLGEAVDQLVTSPDGIYIDATFGRGSHSHAILKRLNANGRLIAFDKDQTAINFAQTHFAHDPRFSIVHASFAALEQVLTRENLLGQVQGILFDLGVSSPQFDDPERGFSFNKSGALDMRMDQSRGMTAKEWIATVDEKKLANVLWEYGEEKFSRRVAKAIVLARAEHPIETTLQLSDIIKFAIPKLKKNYDKHPATRSFQAIRIAINEELNELESALKQTLNALQLGGRIAVISFHSLEDRIVKQFIKSQSNDTFIPRDLPIKGETSSSQFKAIGKPIKPNMKEVNLNPRARSAILRIAEKQS